MSNPLFFICYLFPFIIFSHASKNNSDEFNELPEFHVNLEIRNLPNGKYSMYFDDMEKAAKTFESVMNDKEFQKELLELNFHFDTENDPNKVLSTAQIVSKIYDAKEENGDSGTISTADIYWILKKAKPRAKWKGINGYRNKGSKFINTYSYYFRNSLSSNNKHDIVGHLAHEWSHTLGFLHKNKPHDNRSKTVPYAFGNLVKKHAKKYQN